VLKDFVQFFQSSYDIFDMKLSPGDYVTCRISMVRW